MRVFGVTPLGRRIALTKEGSTPELAVLHYLSDNRTATESELAPLGGERWVLRKLEQRGLVMELTT